MCQYECLIRMGRTETEYGYYAEGALFFHISPLKYFLSMQMQDKLRNLPTFVTHNQLSSQLGEKMPEIENKAQLSLSNTVVSVLRDRILVMQHLLSNEDLSPRYIYVLRDVWNPVYLGRRSKFLLFSPEDVQGCHPLRVASPPCS